LKAEFGKAFVERAAWTLLWLFVFTIPWEKSVWVADLGTFARLLGMAAFAAGAEAAVRRREFRGANLALVLAAAWALWSGATYLWSLDRHATLVRTATRLELVAMFWLIWESCRGASRQRQLMEAYVWGAVAASGIAFTRYALHIQTYYRRYAAAGFDPNDFGLVLALSIPMALYLALTARARDWRAWAYRAAAFVSVAAILLTASRTALIATFIGLGFAAWTWRRADLRQRVSTAALAAVLLLALVDFAPAPQRARLATIPHEVATGTLHNRTRIWKSGLKAFKGHRLLGVGAGAYPEAVRPWLGRPAVPGFQYVAHNTFLSVLVETGAVGFAMYAAMLGVLAVFVWMLPANERALWAVVLAVWAAGVSTLTWEQYKPGWLMAALISTAWARSSWQAGKAE
jgi:O-antigen ligase